MKPEAYISCVGERFPWEGYANIEEPSRGKKPLPKAGYPYSVEFSHQPPHVFTFGEELWDHIHNIMCWIQHEDVETMNFIKNGCKDNPDRLAPFMLEAINFVTNNRSAYCNAHGISDIFDYPLSRERIVDIVVLMSIRKECGIGADVVSAVVDKLLLSDTLSYADALEASLPILVDEEELRSIVDGVLSEFPDKVAEYRGGKKGISGMFIGVVMRKKKGLDPKAVASTIEVALRA